MITIISTTNRPHSSTFIFCKAYQQLLNKLNVKNQLLSMSDLPAEMLFADMFKEKAADFTVLISKYLVDVDKLLVVSPEYNGSFPGIFKSFIDITNPEFFKGKKIALTGVASGRAGNLRGMDHLTDVFHHLKAEVFHNKLPISGIHELINNNEVTDKFTLDLMENQLKDFLNF